jgi:hypothetical protein
MSNKIALLLLVILSACAGKSRLNRDFVDAYEHHNFREFYNKSVLIRSYDRNGPIIFLSNYDDTTNGPFAVTMDKSGQVLEVNKKLLRNEKLVDSLEMINLARHFIKYKIQRIHVDSNGTAFMSLTNNDRDDLIKFSDEKYIRLYDSEYRKKRRIRNLWFEYIDD